jgi:hypothetical protein
MSRGNGTVELEDGPPINIIVNGRHCLVTQD